MPRKLRKKLLDELKNGKLKKLLEYVKTDKELRLEIRDSRVIIYYHKGKVLEIPNTIKLSFNEKYTRKTILSAPEMNLAITNPDIYFLKMKNIINEWERINNRNRKEFYLQQNLADMNKSGKYIIIDMEYSFAKGGITIAERDKKDKDSGFDLLGIEPCAKKALFFEVKKGLTALVGESGIKDHIDRFEQHIYYSKNKDKYRENLECDIKSIISNKNFLGLLDYSLPGDFCIKEIEFAFIFESTDSKIKDEKEDYKIIFQKEKNASTGSKKKYKTFFVGQENYTLSDNFDIL